MSIDSVTGLVQWTPTAAQVGGQAVSVAAVDSARAAGTQGFILTVAPATRTVYDAAGRGIVSIDQANRSTIFHYDPLGRLIETVYPDDTAADGTDNPRTRTEYDAAARTIAKMEELGHRTEFEYDNAGRPIRTIQPEVFDARRGVRVRPETRSTYDPAGRAAAQTDAVGHTTRFAYDSLNRLVQTLFIGGTSTSTTYDALGRRIAQTDQAGVTTRFLYDNLGRQTAVVQPDATPNDLSDNPHYGYGYDELGNFVLQVDANNHVTRYEYDGLGRRTATVLPLGQRSVTTYDPVGNVQSATDFNGNTLNYE